MKMFVVGLFACVLAMAQPSLAAEHSPACTGFRFDVGKELELFGVEARKVTATTTAESAADIDVDQLYEVTLADSSEVTFAATPGKSSTSQASFAGLLRVSAVRAQIIRVTSTEAARLDVISEGKLQESQRHTGSGDCKVLRKVVEFSVTPGQPFIIQISGSPEREIKLAVTTA